MIKKCVKFGGGSSIAPAANVRNIGKGAEGCSAYFYITITVIINGPFWQVKSKVGSITAALDGSNVRSRWKLYAGTWNLSKISVKPHSFCFSNLTIVSYWIFLSFHEEKKYQILKKAKQAKGEDFELSFIRRFFPLNISQGSFLCVHLTKDLLKLSFTCSLMHVIFPQNPLNRC